MQLVLAIPLYVFVGNPLGWLTCHLMDKHDGQPTPPFNWRVFLGYRAYHRWADSR